MMNQMEIKFLGTGGAHQYWKGNAAATIQTSEGLFLVDCGPSTYPTLCELGLIDKIDYFLPTHLHGDHTGGLFQLIVHLKHQFTPKKQLKIVYPNETLLYDMKAFLALMHQFDGDVAYVPISEFKTVGALDTTGQHVPNMPGVAYYFTEHDELIYYSGDLGNVQTTKDFLDSRSESKITVFHDINPKEGPGHVNNYVAAEVLKDYDVYGYHCDKVTLPADNPVKLVEEYQEFLY